MSTLNAIPPASSSGSSSSSPNDGLRPPTPPSPSAHAAALAAGLRYPTAKEINEEKLDHVSLNSVLHRTIRRTEEQMPSHEQMENRVDRQLLKEFDAMCVWVTDKNSN
jgi:hypothetical protein